MADAYRVTAPYVTPKVKDASGAFVVVGYYQGGVITAEIEAASLEHHLNLRMLEKVTVSEDGLVEDGEFDLGPSGAQAPTPIDRFPSQEDDDSDDGSDEPAKEATVKEVLEEVGDDKEKAAEALAAEQAKGENARSSLVSKLEAIANA